MVTWEEPQDSSQQILVVTHRYRFGRDNRFTSAGDLNILNLFDQKQLPVYLLNLMDRELV